MLLLRNLIRSPLFLIGIFFKLIITLFAHDNIASLLYIPFLQNGFKFEEILFWDAWINTGGQANAFPYGIGMIIAFLPIGYIFNLIGISENIWYYSTLLIADGCVLYFLLLCYPKLPLTKVILVYWWSPITILAIYMMGYNDLIPISMLMLSIYLLQKQRFTPSAIVLSLSISTKLSMVIAVPFFLIFIFNTKSIRTYFPQFITWLMLSLITFSIPMLISEFALSMIVENKEIHKVLYLAINLKDGVSIYVLPLIYTIILYTIWRLRKMSFELFIGTIGLSFLGILSFTPAALGWFVWVVPFLAIFQLTHDRLSLYLGTLYSVLYATIATIDYGWLPTLELKQFVPSINTLHVALAIVLIQRIIRRLVLENPYYRFFKKPKVISIAGDSGAGKDTLVSSLVEVFGQHSCASISADDYHLWDRKKPLWQVLTHLNPLANDLSRLAGDVSNLAQRFSIHARHYDHVTGKMTKPKKIKSNDFIFLSGLHAIYTPELKELSDLKIYLDIDEDLRKYFKLKRDVLDRGKSKESVLRSLEERRSDSVKFIRPQRKYADLVLSLQPLDADRLEYLPPEENLKLKLQVDYMGQIDTLAIHRTLVGICGLHVDIEYREDNKTVVIIEGECSSEDIELAFSILCKEFKENMQLQPVWQPNTTGLMQLFIIIFLSNKVKRG